MKDKIPVFVWMLTVTAALIAVAGIFLKYAVLRPLELYGDQPAAAVPFLLIANREDREAVHAHWQEETIPEQTQPAVTEPKETIPFAAETEPEQTEQPVQCQTEPAAPVVIDESWFDDALFIGDSRTEGLAIYARLGEADYFCEVGMTVYNVQTSRCGDVNFEKTSLEELLDSKAYGKVYIGLGLNEIGYNRGKMLEKYGELIELIREKQPEAAVVLQSVMTVGRAKAASREYFSLENVCKLNREIRALSDGVQVHYIDVNEWIADEDGYLPDELSGDGCHLYGSEYDSWAQWLMDSAATLGIEP